MFLGLRSNIGIVGVGLIGGSIGMRLKFSGFSNHIVGIGRNISRLRKAKYLGAIDSFSTSYSRLKDCDIVILSLPVDLIPMAFGKIEKYLKQDAIVTDVGSIKSEVIKAYKKGKYSFRFIPGHPIAGSHLSGIEAARKDLFMGKKGIITPIDKQDKNALITVETMYNFLGMDMLIMNADEHDEILAYASHLPHLISFTLDDIAGKFKDVTMAQSLDDMLRIASSSYKLWSAIFSANKKALLKATGVFEKNLKKYISALKKSAPLPSLKKLRSSGSKVLDVIAIDGPAGAGKSTIAKNLAQKLGWKLIDTGAMYRAATLACMDANVDLSNVKTVAAFVKSQEITLSDKIPQKVFLNGKDVSSRIRRQDVTNNVFFLAREGRIREIMVRMQRKIAKQGRCVIEGRDVTTIVVPEAKYKFYLDACFDERLKRRRKDLMNRGLSCSVNLMLDMLKRDANDLCRKTGPLRKAKDSKYIDTTNMSISDVVNTVYYRCFF